MAADACRDNILYRRGDVLHVTGMSKTPTSPGSPTSTLKKRIAERYGDRKGFIMRADSGARQSADTDRKVSEIVEAAILQAAYAEHGSPAAGKGFPVIEGSKRKGLNGIRKEIEKTRGVVGDVGILPIYPKAWRYLTDETRIRFQQIGLEDLGDWRAMTLHMSDDVLAAMHMSSRTHADFLRRKISQSFRRGLGHVPEFWFKIEYFSKPKLSTERYTRTDPHVHGSIQIPDGVTIPVIRTALIKAMGHSDIKKVGRPPVSLRSTTDALGLGWVNYALETAPLESTAPPYPTSEWLRHLVKEKGRLVPAGTWSCTQGLNRWAKILYRAARYRILAVR